MSLSMISIRAMELWWEKGFGLLSWGGKISLVEKMYSTCYVHVCISARSLGHEIEDFYHPQPRRGCYKHPPILQPIDSNSSTEKAVN